MKRREALKQLSFAAALFGLPAGASASPDAPLPEEGLLTRDPEKYWARIRQEQFLLPGWRAFLNNGSLGVAPKPVVNAVEDYVNRSAALLVEDYPRWGYETLDEYRAELAGFFGCKKDELALMHNATEAMCTIADGLDLKPGDEVIITDQEHPGGRCCWYQKQARRGIRVREVKIPLPPESLEQLADLMISAIGPRTRVISFSGITTKTGLIFPVRRICDAARDKGVISVVDGAHMNGQIPFRISDLGCDYFAGSPHKWLFAPAGSGLLYIREELIDRHWPLIITEGWDDKDLKAARFMRVGTNNRAIFEGLMAGVRFARELGPERIYARLHQLAKATFEMARARPYIEMLTPDDDRMYGGMVTVRFKTKDLAPLWKLCDERRIWTTKMHPLRLSTHIHTRLSDVELFFRTADETLGRRKAA
jgi:selenocysteine lyase/cysteine desulfurase